MEKEIKNRKIMIYTTIEVFLVFLLTILGSCWDWVNFTFSFEQVLTGSFWSETIIKSAQYALTMATGIIYTIGKLEVTNEEYFKTLETYRMWLKFKLDSFSKYIDTVLNPLIKKEKIKSNINVQLHRLNKKSKDTYLIEFQDAVDSGEFENYAFSSEQSKKYYIRRTELERLKSDEYIDKNINSITVKYPRVNDMAFTYYLTTTENDDDRWKVENTTGKDVGIKGSIKFVSVFLLTVVLGLFLINPSGNELLEQANGWIAIMIEYIIRIIMLAGNLLYGIWFGRRIFHSNYTMVINNRTEILKKYVDWSHEHQEKSYADKIIESYEKNEKLKADLDSQIRQLEESRKGGK